MKWSTAQARTRLAQLFDEAHVEPQEIFRRSKRVAVVIDPELFDAFERWQREQVGRSLAADAAELAALCRETGYELPISERRDRDDPFGA
jgi:hypothetical protein